MKCSMRALIFSLSIMLSIVGRGNAEVFDQDKFVQENHWGSMLDTVGIRFTDNGEVLTVQKTGKIRLYNSIEADQSEFQTIYDFSKQTYSWWDRGMLGLAVHPAFPIKPYIWVLYSINDLETSDATSPVETLWPKTECPLKRPSPDGRGTCASHGRLDRLRFDANQGRAHLDQVLIDDWCSYSGSHHVNHLEWAPDGSLYLSAGDGALFNGVDMGREQDGCFDKQFALPQGAFRAQWNQFLHGKILNIRASSLMARNRLQKDHDFRIVAKGFRNPYRFSVDPNNGDLWVTDVGSQFNEEVNRVPNPLRTAEVPNYGWPCIEGHQPSPSLASHHNMYCRSAASSGLFTEPFFSYDRHSLPLPPNQAQLCQSTSASATGSLVYTGKDFPQEYQNSLFFLDGAKRCVFVFGKDEQGHADPSQLNVFAFTRNPTDAKVAHMKPGQYVDIVQGPKDGYIYLVDVLSGKVDRIRSIESQYARPKITLSATPGSSSQQVPAKVTLRVSGVVSNVPNAMYLYDVDGDGSVDVSSRSPELHHIYNDAGAYKPAVTLIDSSTRKNLASAGTHVVVGSKVNIAIGMSPSSGHWSVGDTISFAADIRRTNGGQVPPDSIRWAAFLHHCAPPSPCAKAGNHTSEDCHVHPLELANPTQSTIDLKPPQHEMPSYISVRVTTHIDGVETTATATTRPSTYTITLESSPPGLQITSTCFSKNCKVDVMRKGRLALDIQGVQALHGRFYRFVGWEGFGEDLADQQRNHRSIEVNPTRNHNVVARFQQVQTRKAPASAQIARPELLQIRAQRGRLDVTWRVNQARGSRPPAYFQVECVGMDSSAFLVLVSGASSSAQVYLPTAVAMYKVTVAGIGRDGRGPSSIPGVITTPQRSDSFTSTLAESCPIQHDFFVARNAVSFVTPVI